VFLTAPLIKLDSNENPFGPSPLALAAMQSGLIDCGCYPDDHSSALRHKLAQVHGVSAEEILVTGGLTELLGMIARTFLLHGRNAVTSVLSFMVYRLATKATNTQLIELPLRKNGFDLEAIARAVNRDSGIVFLANPNNPTGSVITADELAHFLGKIPDHVVVVIDEAYYEYAAAFAAIRGVDYSRSLEYVRQGRNVVVLRTFSKVHGLAGARVGYGVAPVKVIEQISRQRAMYCVSSLAQAGALAALDDHAHIRKAVENNTRESERLVAALTRLGFSVTPTWANFLYCDLRQDAASFARDLHDSGIAVRALDQWGAPQAIRTTIGTPKQNDALLSALASLRRS
jgi:histidinol-phosphate aminotransferase